MIFETGDLIVLGILTILLFVFRQFDRNNRSLEKVRSYADKVKAQLDELVQEKKEALRDLSIDMDIQEKTDKEILKRVEAARGEMISHAESIDNFNEKVTIYNERVEELVAMTARIDENLLRIKDESEYVDSVGKRISESLRKIQLLEKAMGSLQDEFVKQNKANLDQFQDSLLQSSEERIRVVEDQIGQSEQMVSRFRQTIDEAENRYDGISEEKIALFEKELDSVRDTYNGYLADIADRGLKLESEVFDELNNSINTTADRIEDNWKNGINELKDSIASTVEDIKSRISSVEEGIGIVENDSLAAAERLTERHEALDAEIQKAAEQRFSEISAKIGSFEEGTDEKLAVLSDAQLTFESGVKKTAEEKFAEAIALIEDYQEEAQQKLEILKAAQQNNEADIKTAAEEKFAEAAALIERYKEESEQRLETLKAAHLNSEADIKHTADERFASATALIENFEQETSSRLEVLTGRFGDHEELMRKEADEVLERCRLLIRDHEEDSSSLVEKMKANMEEVTLFSDKISNQMDSFKAEIDRETAELGERLNNISGDMERSIDEKAAELETGLMRSVEEKVGEYEQAVSRRFDRLDGFMEDLDNLESNLKVSLQEAVASVERDFQIFNENLSEERAAFRQSLSEDTNDLRAGMDELESGLEALKSRAYENVSEKLKVFEDEFFSDLKKRDTAMQSSLVEWQKNIDFRMEEIDLKGSREREELQQFCSSDMKVKLSELQSRVYGQFDDFKLQVQDFRDTVQNSISGTEEEMKNFTQSVTREIDGLKENSSGYFEEQFSEFKRGIAERFDKADKTIDIKFDEMMSGMDLTRKELDSSLERSRADLSAWQLKIEQQMKEDESGLADQMQAFKTDMGENISLIRDDFRSQREELIVSTNEERANLRREISENSARLEELNKELERSSLQAMDKFRSDYDDFILDFQRKSHEIQNEADVQSRDVRQGLADTREKVDALQKKMFGRIEDDYNLLSGNLREIEAKQQDFISQTQIFERADTLKEALSADIDALKEQVAMVEKNSSEAFRLKEEYADILRLNEEIQNKLSNVMSEKQKIDTMDERINRIINLSDSVNLKLDEVSTIHDTLQEYQVRLRQIEDLQDSIDKRYARLEKKNAILDTTTEGVDKNFQLMETIEKALNTVRGELAPLFSELKEAKEQHTVLQGEQEKIRSVVDKLANLEEVIADLDNRIESMNKAREWVAGTEARMETIGKKAREQVQLFGKLMEKEGQAAAAPARRRGTAAPGSPDMEIREMVLRLAHEGWKSEEIARTTKLSQGEVELILELSPDFTRK